MTKTIIFDVGEVLYQGFYGMHERLTQALGRPIQHSDLQTEELDKYFRGRISENALWRSMIERFGWNISVAGLRDMVRDNFKPVPGTLDIVRKLRKNGHFLAILSVHGREWAEFIDGQHQFHRLFNYRAYSYETRLCKPDPAAFMAVARAMRCQPRHCLLIDGMRKNIAAADQLQFRTHRFVSAPKLEAYLTSRRFM